MSKLGSIKILAIDLIENKKANFIDQDETEATYAKKMKKMKQINMERNREVIARLMHLILIQDHGLS